MKFLKISILMALICGLGFFVGHKLHASKNSIRAISLKDRFSMLSKIALNPAYAQSAPSAMDSLRNDIFLIVGYPSQAVWDDLNEENGPPVNGLLGMMDDIFDGIAQIAVANAVSDCTSVPATGTATGSIQILDSAISGTITYGTPSKTVPTGWTNGTQTYEKKVSFDSDSYDVSVEFFCDKAVAYASMSIPGDTVSGSTRILNLYIDTETADDSRIEMGMKVTHATDCGATDGNPCDVMLLRAQTGSSNHFQLWGSYFAWRDTKYQAQRTVIDGNYSTYQMSSYYHFESDFGSTYTNIVGTDPAAVASGDYDFSQQTTADRSIRGCVDYNSPDTALSASSDCGSYALSAPPTNVFGAGDYTYTGLRTLEAQIVAP